MNEKLFTVYRHITPSGKSYFGITSSSVEKRKKQGYRHNAYMSAAIKKYGWENIQTEIIAEGVSLEEANLLEIYYISSFETQDHKHCGYNIADGGYLNAESEETRQKIIAHMPNKKKIMCVETEEIFNGVREASRAKGVFDGDISRCAKGKRKTAGGFHWRYVDE